MRAPLSTFIWNQWLERISWHNVIYHVVVRYRCSWPFYVFLKWNIFRRMRLVSFLFAAFRRATEQKKWHFVYDTWCAINRRFSSSATSERELKDKRQTSSNSMDKFIQNNVRNSEIVDRRPIIWIPTPINGSQMSPVWLYDATIDAIGLIPRTWQSDVARNVAVSRLCDHTDCDSVHFGSVKLRTQETYWNQMCFRLPIANIVITIRYYVFYSSHFIVLWFSLLSLNLINRNSFHRSKHIKRIIRYIIVHGETIAIFFLLFIHFVHSRFEQYE